MTDMTDQRCFDWGMLAGMLLMLGAFAAHWFITPASHPRPSGLVRAGVAAEFVLGFGVAMWIIFRLRPGGTAAPPSHT